MAASPEPWQPLLDALAPLRSGWPAPDWTWDPRLECATSPFDVSLAPRVRDALAPALPAEWTATSISGAPDGVRALSTRSGSLRANQLLLTGPEVAGMFPFALWWPWGDGARVSVRVGIASAERPKELSASIRALFGLP
ncbi:MAG TPA: hypothetical protein VML54_11590 [Candidatus Limnocylindrales bacterium]|nr:hypothetical protein [Candidatus Limnocylindrales bacterium]